MSRLSEMSLGNLPFWSGNPIPRGHLSYLETFLVVRTGGFIVGSWDEARRAVTNPPVPRGSPPQGLIPLKCQQAEAEEFQVLPKANPHP